MQIIGYQTELFPVDPVPTEYYAYQQLKTDPLKRDVTYLAVPWAVLINKQKLDSLKLKNVKGLGFTVCQHTHYKKIIPILKQGGIQVLFAPHVGKWHWGVRGLPFPHYVVNGAEPAPVKDIFYSFVGIDSSSMVNKDVRKEIFSMSHPKNTVVIKRKQWHWAKEAGWGDLSPEQQEKEKIEYCDILSRSRFSLCPRGFGSSTIRFWESLQAGAIPVLISDAMRLPSGFKWQRCMIRIPEKKVDRLSEFLSQVSREKETEMRQACFEACRQFSGENFVSTIRDYYYETL